MHKNIHQWDFSNGTSVKRDVLANSKIGQSLAFAYILRSKQLFWKALNVYAKIFLKKSFVKSKECCIDYNSVETKLLTGGFHSCLIKLIFLEKYFICPKALYKSLGFIELDQWRKWRQAVRQIHEQFYSVSYSI